MPYILVSARLGAARSVLLAARDVPGVLAAEGVVGPYDVILQLDPPAAVADVLRALGDVPGISRTITCERSLVS